MAHPGKNSIREYRRRLRRKGAVRLEVQVHKDDAPLIRGIARALSDPAQETETRRVLRERFGGRVSGLKALLASAPFDGIELSRESDQGRYVDL